MHCSNDMWSLFSLILRPLPEMSAMGRKRASARRSMRCRLPPHLLNELQEDDDDSANDKPNDRRPKRVHDPGNHALERRNGVAGAFRGVVKKVGYRCQMVLVQAVHDDAAAHPQHGGRSDYA